MDAIRFLACLALTVALFARSSAALADQPPTSPPPATVPALAPSTRTAWHWYGWQVLVADASLAGLAALGEVKPLQGEAGVGLAGIGAVGYVVDGLVIHAAHREYLAAGASVGVRLVFPLLGAVIGAETASCGPPPPPSEYDYYPPDPCWASLDGAVFGFAGGMLMASIVDAAIFSWERAPAPNATASKAAHFSLLPRVAAMDDVSHRRVVSVGVAGAF
jgi:hypothetical protein